MRLFPLPTPAAAALLALLVATSCEEDAIAPPPPPPAVPFDSPPGLAWVRCPTDDESRGSALLGDSARASFLEVDGHRVELPAGLAPARTVELIVHRSAGLFVTVNVAPDSIPGGATLELSLARCPGAIPAEGKLYLFRIVPPNGPHELVDSASTADLRRDGGLRAEGLRRFSGFVIAGG